MTKTPANINKILEIDMDTMRETPLIIKHVSGAEFKRERQPDPTFNIIDDLVILTNALGSAILFAEQKGVVPKGAAMARAIDYLGEVYTNAGANIVANIVDQDGNVISERII